MYNEKYTEYDKLVYEKELKDFLPDEFIDFQLPFGGLVESCFSGMNYGNLLEAVEAFMDRLAYHLLLICNINSHKIKPLN